MASASSELSPASFLLLLLLFLFTSFFSPAPKRRAPEEHSVSADKNMQLLHDSMGQETRPPRPETEVCTSDHLRIHLRGPKFQNFPGGACPHTPLVCALRTLPSTTSNSVPPLFFIPGSTPVIITTDNSLCLKEINSCSVSTPHASTTTLCIVYGEPCIYNLVWCLSV